MTPTRQPSRPLRTAALLLTAVAVVAGLLWGTSLLPRGTTQESTQEPTRVTDGSPSGDASGDPGADPGVGDPAGICAVAVVFEGRTYYGEPAGDVRPGRALGTGTVPACNDTPGAVDDAEPGTAEVRAVPGESPAQVVLVGDTLFRAAPDQG